MILVTAATGKTGRHVIDALRRRGEPVRAIARSEDVHELRADGVETMTGDLLDRDAVRRAVDGARAVAFIGPTYDAMETAMGINFAEASLAVGLERFLFFSVTHPHIEFLLNHKSKLRFEDHLINTGLEFTILQSMNYMQNFDPTMTLQDGVFRVPYDVSRKHSWVDLVDIGEAAALVLTEEGHANATYPLSGADVLSAEDMAAVIAAAADQPISTEQMPIEDFVAFLSASGPLPAYTLNSVYRISTFYGLHSVLGNANVLRWLLGREPNTFAEYVERTMQPAATAA